MKIEILKRRIDHEQNRKYKKEYIKMEELIEALNKKGIPEENVVVINVDVKMINSFLGTEKELTSLLKKTYKKLLIYIEKELNLVKKFHYQNSWMAYYGMLAGVTLSTVFNNFIELEVWNVATLGISIGMLFGLLAGQNRDKTAVKDGLQLDL